VREAEAAEVHGRLDLAFSRFRAPVDMLDEIRQACTEEGAQPPGTRGECARLIFDSMVTQHKEAVASLAALTGRCFRRVHMVSGGSRNAYLCQALADALGIPVLAGPAEATAAGNVLLQASAMGVVTAGEERAGVLSASFPKTRYEPRAL
jgi:rhamnulokinase